jgi:hypothetical protein
LTLFKKRPDRKSVSSLQSLFNRLTYTEQNCKQRTSAADDSGLKYSFVSETGIQVENKNIQKLCASDENSCPVAGGGGAERGREKHGFSCALVKSFSD